MDLLTIGQWAGTIVALIAAIPGICAFMSLRAMRRLKVDVIYAPTYQEATFPGRFFLILNITPGARDTFIRSV